MSYQEENGAVVFTDAAIEPMAEILLYRLTQLPLTLTYRQKYLGQALFRSIAERKPQLLLNQGNPNYTPYQVKK